MSDKKEGKIDVDENSRDELYNARSRDAAALGFDTIKRVAETSVLVIGLQGVGVETAKNIILNGPKKVTLHDTAKVQIADLGTNFYLLKEHVGKRSRAEASLAELQGLNPGCVVEVYDGKLSYDFLKLFDMIVVSTFLPQDELVRINEVARSRTPTRSVFIWAVTHGVVGSVFSDFGPAHVITDPNGQPVRELVVSNITPDGLVTVTAPRHDLENGSYIKFAELEGSISKLNGLDGIKIKEYRICGLIKGKDGKETRSTKPNETVPNKFLLDVSEIKDLKEIGEWINGGIIVEVKPKNTINYKSLKESLLKPAEFVVPHMDAGLAMDGRGNQLHLATLALLRFQKEKGALPALHSQADADAVYNFAKAINDENAKLNATDPGHVEVKEVDRQLINKVSKYARTELSGYAAFLGGLAAQELVKLWGKYTPVSQWLYADHFELVQADVPEDAILQGSRYDHQIAIFGKAVQRKISNQKWFLVGVGALGCEYLKAYALMGLGTGSKGSIHITDMDNIELSNLSRQFLFRRQHVGKSKATCAAEAVTVMNPELKGKITVHIEKVWSGSEHLFDDAFWNNLDGVWNALDNVQARQYTDSKCLLHLLPLLESGTQGTAGSTDVVLPFKTTSYQDGEIAETGGIAACTLKNFPNEILHCIEWARPQFFELFDHEPSNYNLWAENKEKFFSQIEKAGHVSEKVESLRKVKRLAELAKDRTMNTAIRLAFEKFDHEYRVRIKDLIHFFPENSRITDPQTKADLGAFWTGAKRFPRAAEFNLDDDQHFGYVYNASLLFAHMLGVKEPIVDPGTFKEAVKALNWKAPEWKAPSGGKPQEIEESDKASAADETDDEFELVRTLTKELEGLDSKTLGLLKPQEFEKDDDTNHHIDFITYCSNLRAWNYKIQPSTRAKVKVTAGRIIPALATTTAATTGLMTLEFYKLILGFQNISQTLFRNSQIDFANSTFNVFQPSSFRRITTTKDTDPESKAVTVHKAYPSVFGSWDKVVVRKGNLTVKEFVDLFPSVHFGVTIDSLFKAELSDKDKGSFLYGAPIRPTNFFKQQLKNKSLSDEKKAKFAADLKSAEEMNARIKEEHGTKLVDLYIKKHGPLAAESRDYILLGGIFRPPSGDEDTTAADNYAKIPVIQYFFK